MTFASELGRQLGPLRRSVTQATRAEEALPDLPEAHIEVLRLLGDQPDLSTTQIAGRLRLARPTVSNLLSSMVRSDLVELVRQSTDRRLVTVRRTPRAVELLARYDVTSERIIDEALARLSSRDRSALEKAVPAMERLIEVLNRP
ncbi:MarR family winged helix-turn-helix transcriptional regulator [Herbiconiux liangxiaofengii]|uniref:MarR family winged helix-turn-helix transcriptional regulator n=1 Tax=Herbiconiux liangxiaofengii TaxID=3342795 RepID=UPI0035B7DF22